MLSIEPEMGNRLINSSPVMILSSRKETRVNMMAVSWVTWISCNPPLVGVSISPGCFTHHILKETGDFVLNIPDKSLIHLVHQVGMTSGYTIDKMRVFDIVTVWGHTVKALTLSYAIGALECQIQDFQSMGDHTFFIARVLYASVDNTVWDGYWTEEAGLLHYLGGDKYLCSGKILKPQIKNDYCSLREMQLKREREARDLFDSP